jgi:23S rRNA pseudouridine2605 synthase
MKERIQKIISGRGMASRRKAEEWITQGRVTCNGVVCALGDTADPETDTVLVDGKPLAQTQQRLYIMLNKPRGFVTTLSDEKGRQNASQLVADCGQRVYPVGRLDMDSEGLLLFTNDGDFANRLMHPSHEVQKTYLVWVRGFTREGLSRFERPMELDGYALRLPAVSVERQDGPKAVLRITIHEGRNRQVRRMCAIAGMEVTRLRRIREGNLELGDLPVGKWRYLTAEEVASL